MLYKRLFEGDLQCIRPSGRTVRKDRNPPNIAHQLSFRISQSRSIGRKVGMSHPDPRGDWSWRTVRYSVRSHPLLPKVHAPATIGEEVERAPIRRPMWTPVVGTSVRHRGALPVINAHHPKLRHIRIETMSICVGEVEVVRRPAQIESRRSPTRQSQSVRLAGVRRDDLHRISGGTSDHTRELRSISGPLWGASLEWVRRHLDHPAGNAR